MSERSWSAQRQSRREHRGGGLRERGETGEAAEAIAARTDDRSQTIKVQLERDVGGR